MVGIYSIPDSLNPTIKEEVCAAVGDSSGIPTCRLTSSSLISGGYLLVGAPAPGIKDPHQQPPEKEKTYDMSTCHMLWGQELHDRPSVSGVL